MRHEMYGAVRPGESDPVVYTDDVDEAREHAREHKLQLVAYVFDLADTELVEDFTDGA